MSLPQVGGRRRNGQTRNPCGGTARPAPTPAVLQKAGCRTAGRPAPEAVVLEPLSTVMPPSRRQPSSAFVRATVSYAMPRATIVRCTPHPVLRLPPVGSDCASHCSPRSQSRPSHNFPSIRANPPSSAVMRRVLSPRARREGIRRAEDGTAKTGRRRRRPHHCRGPVNAAYGHARRVQSHIISAVGPCFFSNCWDVHSRYGLRAR